jgi:hydrogenase maturation protease
MGRIGVLGLGNVLMGDDAVGAHVLAHLAAGWEFPPEVELLEAGTPGAGLPALLRDHQAVVVVDAVRLRAPPGEVRILDRAELLGRTPILPMSPHEPGLREALLTMDFEGSAPPVVRLVGVVPGKVELSLGLSTAVAQAVPALVAAVLRELAALGVVARPRLPPLAPDLWWERPPEG